MTLMHKMFTALVIIGASMSLTYARQASLATITVQFRFAESAPGKGLTGAIVHGTNERVYLHKECIVSQKDIIEARVVESDNLLGGTSRYVEVIFTKDAAERLAKATKVGIGRLLAIVVDGEVVSAPVVHGTIYERAAISSEKMSKEEAERIAAALSQISFPRTHKPPTTR